MYRSLATLAVLTSLFLVRSRVMTANDSPLEDTPCEDGYRVVEETCYRQVVTRSYCRIVPDVKTVKKYVYSMKEVPVCQLKCPNLFRRRGDCSDPCPECADHPRCKRILVKHEVIEKVAGFKCVVECETENVPYSVFHLVPCSTAEAEANIEPR